MKLVRFTKPMAPYGVGDTSLLPDAVADQLVAAREAELGEMPSTPHAVSGPFVPAQQRQSYTTKDRRNVR